MRKAVFVVCCLALSGVSVFAQGGVTGTSGAADRIRALEAERQIALGEMAQGQWLKAIERLERVLPERGTLPREFAPAMATLAIAYDEAGLRREFALAAGSALQLDGSGAFANDLRLRMRLREGAKADSIDASVLTRTITRSEVADGQVTVGWGAFARGAFDSAAASFGRAADSMPAALERWQTRTLQAQAIVQSARPGRAGQAAAMFSTILDSARALTAAVDGRVAAGAATTFGRAAMTRQSMAALWAGDVLDKRLLRPEAAAGATEMAVLTRGDIQQAFAAMGAAGNDPVARALAWTRGGTNGTAMKVLADSLAEADAIAVRRAAHLADLRAGRAGRVADAARYVTYVRTFADSIAASDRELTRLRTLLAQSDTAIGAKLAEYRRLVENKIKDARELAAQNLARVDSIERDLQRAGQLLTNFAADERATAREYLAVAEAAEQALDQGMNHLSIVVERDTVRAKYARMSETLAQSRAWYDSALQAATNAEMGVTRRADGEIAVAQTELNLANTAVGGLVERSGVAAGALLVSRVPALKGDLARVATTAQAGLANAVFFAAIEADTVRGVPAEVSSRRNSALTQLSDLLGAPLNAAQSDPNGSGNGNGNSNSNFLGNSVRASLVLELAELLTRKADADFAASQRTANALERPDYAAAIARYDELLRLYPNDPRVDVAAYTMGTLAMSAQRYADADRALAIVTAKESSPFRAESFFRSGDSRFEQAIKLAGQPRRDGFAASASAYDRAITLAPAQGDIYFLSLYKLGWSNYMQAERQSSDEYQRAVEVFGRLVREVDALPPERQARLALRQEAIDYLAIAITQLGGIDEGVKTIGAIPDVGTRILVLRRVAHALRDQGEFNSAVIAFRGALTQAPVHPSGLETRLEMVDLFQSRMLEPLRAQEARIELVDSLAPGSAWASANPGRLAEAQVAREKALREAGSFALTRARGSRDVGRGTPGAGTTGAAGARGTTQRVGGGGLVVATTADGASAYSQAAGLLARYVIEFPGSDSAQRVSALEGDARFGARDWFASGKAYTRTATKWNRDSATMAAARRNAMIAYDSALVNERRNTVRDVDTLRAMEDSLFSATERFVALGSSAAGGSAADDSRQALVVMGRRASESARWEIVATTFTRVADGWPADPIAPEARKFVGDARYKQGRYAEAQAEWKKAFDAATANKRKALADSIVNVRVAAAAAAADSLVGRGLFERAADSVLTAMASDIADPIRAADLLRNAVEVHLDADSTARAKTDTARANAARLRAIGAIETLQAKYPAYQHTLTYSALRAKLLADAGKPLESVAALQQLADANPRWTGRADGLLRAAFLLDSLGKPKEAALAYEKFAGAYPSDKRAADAQYNAAVILRDSKDYAGAASAFLAFVNRYPGEPRIGDAFAARIAMVRATGDTTALGPELARLCVRPAASLAALGANVAATCADRQGAREFYAGMAMWDRYAALKLEIRTAAQLTGAGVAAASAEKQRILKLMGQSFTRAVAQGAPMWVAAASYQSGLAQWYYGLFLRDVVLPADISEAARTGATNGSSNQAQQYFDAAIAAWTALVTKAETDKFDNAWVEKARAALAGEGIPARVKTP